VITLTRFCYAPHVTFGQMVIDGTTFYSVEQPWRDNEPLISCIPEGVYKCTWQPTSTSVPDSYEHHTWYVSSTDGERGLVGYDFGVRTRIAWHIGNTAGDVTGCLAFGLRLSNQFSGAVRRYSTIRPYLGICEVLTMSAHENVKKNPNVVEWNSVEIQSSDGDKGPVMAVSATYGYDEKSTQVKELNELVEAIAGVSNARAARDMGITERDQGRGGR